MPGNGRAAIITVTRNGTILGERLYAKAFASDLYVPVRFAPLAPRAKTYEELPDIIGGLFREYSGLVMFLALGATIRLLAPYLKDKHSDPAVVVVDDQGRFAISALSGHIGGGNVLAKEVAKAIGAQAVITTASDSAGTLSVDLLGRQFGWRIANPENITTLSAAVVNGEDIGVFQDAGERHWWDAEYPLPANIHVAVSVEGAEKHQGGSLIITDRLLEGEDSANRRIIYRPRSLVVGIGCNRGTSAEEIEAAVGLALTTARLSEASIRSLATIDIKQDETGLLEYRDHWGHRLELFSKEELAAVDYAPNPSAKVRRHVGVNGVCEPAALLAAGAKELLVPKTKCGNVTIAVARKVL